MKLFSSNSFKKQVISCFLLSSLFVSTTFLHGDEASSADASAIDLRLNLKKGDKLTYQDQSDFALYLDVPAEFIKEIKEDPSIDSMTKELYITPTAEAIAQKKPLIVFKTKSKDQLEVSDISESKDRFTLDYSIWITHLLFQEVIQGNKIVYESEVPANNSAPADLPISFKDQKNIFPFVFKAIVDPQYRVIQFIDLSKAVDKFIDNISSPFLTPEVAADIKAKVKELAAEENKKLEATAKDSFSLYPPHPVKVNDSWISSLSTQAEAEWSEALSKESTEDEKAILEMGKKVYDKLFKIKSTLISRKDGIATVKLEMLNKDSVSFDVPGDYKLDITGDLVDGTVDFNEATGAIIAINNKTNFKFKMTYNGDVEKKKKFDPQYIEVRFEGLVSSILMK